MGKWTRAVAVWAAILLLAIVNGVAREALLVPMLGPAAGLVASGAVLAVLVLLAALASVRWLAVNRREAWGIGALWLALTLAFEFSFGAFVQHKAWGELLAAYTFRGGNLWPVVLAVIAVAPALARRLRPPAR